MGVWFNCGLGNTATQGWILQPHSAHPITGPPSKAKTLKKKSTLFEGKHTCQGEGEVFRVTASMRWGGRAGAARGLWWQQLPLPASAEVALMEHSRKVPGGPRGPPQLRRVWGRGMSPGHENTSQNIKGYSLFQGIKAWHFPQKISHHGRQWPRLCKDLGIKKIQYWVVMVCSDWSAGKKHLQKMPSWQLKPNLRKDSAMRCELPLLDAYVFSIKMSLSTPMPSSYSAGRNTKLAL